MVWITAGSVTAAITRSIPPQVGHTKISISKQHEVAAAMKELSDVAARLQEAYARWEEIDG